MPLTHELAEEFTGREEEIERLVRQNPRFAALADRARALYRDISHHDRAATGDDDHMKTLKVQRLGVLDEMSAILRNGEPQAGAAARP